MRSIDISIRRPDHTWLGQVLLLAVLALSACGGGSAGTSAAASGATTNNAGVANIASVSPATAQTGVATTFAVSGSNLPLTATATLAGGTCAAITNATPSSFNVICTAGLSGIQSMTITSNTIAAGGISIGQASITIVNGAGTGTSTATVTGMTPTTARPAVPTTFTVSGTNLPLTATALMSGGICGAATVATATSFKVVCTPGAIGTSTVSINSNSNVAGGILIGQATIIITNGAGSGNDPDTGAGTIIVTSMTPITAPPGRPTAFTFTGINLPSTVAVTLSGGSCLAPTNVTSTGFAVVCTPGPLGTAVVTINSNSVGDVPVGQAPLTIAYSTAAGTITVTGMTPTSAKTGVATTFTFTGANLPPTVAVALQGGSCLASTAVTTTGFSVVCTPGAVGKAAATINNTSAADGYAIGQTSLTVTDTADTGATVVTGIAPAFAPPGVTTAFTVSGSNLSLTSFVLMARGVCGPATSSTATSFKVTCTPGPLGMTDVTVYNNTVVGGGYWIGQVSVAVTNRTGSNIVDGTPVVSAITPTTGRSGVLTKFTVSGSNLPEAAVMSLGNGGTCLAPTNNLIPFSFDVSCTLGPVGTTFATITNAPVSVGGYWIGQFSIATVP